jgi:hypothetical protein
LSDALDYLAELPDTAEISRETNAAIEEALGRRSRRPYHHPPRIPPGSQSMRVEFLLI